MAEIDYDKMLELADEVHTAVSFVEEDEDDSRFKYSCILHFDNAADPVWQFDHQGKARDGKYPDVVNPQQYSIYQVWTVGTVEPGLTTREPVDRALEEDEYMLATHVDLTEPSVEVDITEGWA